eukprot:5465162-Alexandrium_andersonii.AAC.1
MFDVRDGAELARAVHIHSGWISARAGAPGARRSHALQAAHKRLPRAVAVQALARRPPRAVAKSAKPRAVAPWQGSEFDSRSCSGSPQRGCDAGLRDSFGR